MLQRECCASLSTSVKNSQDISPASSSVQALPPFYEIKQEKSVVDSAAAAAALSAVDCDTSDAEVFLTKWVASIRPAATASVPSAPSEGYDSPASISLDIIDQDEGFQWGADSDYVPSAATAALRMHLRWGEEEPAASDEGMSCGAALSLYLEQQQQQAAGRGLEASPYYQPTCWNIGSRASELEFF